MEQKEWDDMDNTAFGYLVRSVKKNEEGTTLAETIIQNPVYHLILLGLKREGSYKPCEIDSIHSQTREELRITGRLWNS
jgi:hypothetical protein